MTERRLIEIERIVIEIEESKIIKERGMVSI